MKSTRRDEQTARTLAPKPESDPTELDELVGLANLVVKNSKCLFKTALNQEQSEYLRIIRSSGEDLIERIQKMLGGVKSHAPTFSGGLIPSTSMNAQLAELQKLGGDDFVAELMAEFQFQVQSDFAEIDSAAQASDYSELRRLAHRLKGSSTTVGKANITAICNEMETYATEQNDKRISMAIKHLSEAIHEDRTIVAERVNHVRILIADDHPVVRFGVRRMLQSHGQYLVVGEAADGKEAIREMTEMQPDILLLDLNMPLLPGLETLRELTTIQIPTKTILLTSAISSREILEALQLGARGVVLKDALTTDLAQCITTVMNGQYWLGRKPVTNLVEVLNELMEEIKEPPRNTFGLTIRELEVVRLIAQGMTNKDIAQECTIAEETVKRHLKNIFDKVGVWNRLELALFAINNHLAMDARADS